MSTDRELLELAAKAAGVPVFSYIDSELFGPGINTGEVDCGLWNPLTDDGDALRLAVKLGITIDTPVGGKWVYAGGNGCHSEPSSPDMFAAARRAIVRAAAEIVRAMP